MDETSRLFFHRSLFLSLIAGAVVSSLFVQTADATAERGFDVNDVSYLFPQTSDLKSPFYPTMRVSDAKFIDLQLFGEVLTRFTSETEGTTGFNSFNPPNFLPEEAPYFYVVNFRYDPCFTELAPERCVRQIRLVVQPFDNGENQSGFGGVANRVPDYSMHLIYNLGEGSPTGRDPVLQAILNLKREIEASGFSQAGLPLMTSPALSAEIQTNGFLQDGKIAAKIRALIGNYATADNLAEITVINGSPDVGAESDGAWNMVGGKVMDGHWIPQSIPRTGNQRLQVTDGFGKIATGAPKGPPLSPSGEQIRDVSKKPKDPKTRLVLSDVEQILNPQRTNTRNMDCASCHLASVAEARLQKGLGSNGLKPEPFGLFKEPSGITAFTTDKRKDSGKLENTIFNNVHVIGYFEDSPVVTLIVVKSAGLVAQKLNEILNLSNPARTDP